MWLIFLSDILQDPGWDQDSQPVRPGSRLGHDPHLYLWPSSRPRPIRAEGGRRGWAWGRHSILLSVHPGVSATHDGARARPRRPRLPLEVFYLLPFVACPTGTSISTNSSLWYLRKLIAYRPRLDLVYLNICISPDVFFLVVSNVWNCLRSTCWVSRLSLSHHNIVLLKCCLSCAFKP